MSEQSTCGDGVVCVLTLSVAVLPEARLYCWNVVWVSFIYTLKYT